MLAMEETRKAAEPKSDLEIEAQQKSNNVLARARQHLEEQHDDVKHMNSLLLYAKCATIRELQLDEKEKIKEEEKRVDQLAHEMMEVERLKALEMYEERERRVAEETKKGAAVIRTQIEARCVCDLCMFGSACTDRACRERERRREQELKDQEGEALLRQIEAMKIEEKKAHEAKLVQQRQMRELVERANEEQIKRKAELVIAEQEENQRIADYIADKERREAEHQAELQAVAAAKEREVARLRAMQEKASDKAAEQDALRARRAQEARERQYREQELAATRKRAAINADLAAAREQQQAERERLVAEAVRAEKAEFERVLAVQKAAAEREMEKEHQEQMRRRMHADEVRAQIAEKENERRRQRQEFFEEGRRIKQQTEKEKTHLEQIKQRKMEEMRASGVPEKFLVQLLNKQMLSSP